MRTTFVPEPMSQVKTVTGEPGACPSLESIQKMAQEDLKLGASLELIQAAPSDPCFKVSPDKLLPFLQWLRDDLRLGFNFLQVVSAVDYVAKEATENQTEVKPRMEVLYVLYSLPLATYLNVKVELSRESPQIDSVSHLFRAANWYERECFDMMGINFKGHPYLERILLPPDWQGHPLRKDYEFPEVYNGMKVPL